MTPQGTVEISFDDYKKVGGFKAAIDREAETVFALFPDEQKEIERLFQRITEKGEGEKPIRKPETLAVLTEITGLGATRLNQIVNAFAAHDLLVLRDSEQGGIEVDLPHECLEWKWERLKRWIDQEATLAKSLEFLKNSAEKRQWVTGTALSEALRLREQGRLDGAWPRRYLSDSELVAIKEWIGKSEQRDTAERLRGRRRAIAVTVAVLVVAVGGLIFFYEMKARRAKEETQRREFERTQKENFILHKRATADSLLQRGEHERQIGKYKDSLQPFTSALAAYKELTDNKGQVAALIDIGDVQALTRRFPDAESTYVQAGKMAKEGNELNLEGRALESLASVNEQEHRLKEALDYYEQALRVYQLAGDSEASGRVLEKLGFEAEHSRQLRKAEALYEKARKNYTDSGNVLGKFRTKRALETVREELGVLAWGFLVDLRSGQTYDLKGGSVNVGRNAEGITNDISFENRMVSRRHLAISRNLHIDDMRSTNGTTINARVLPYGIGAALSDQDIIVLANVEPLQFSVNRPPSPLSIPAEAWAVFIDGESRSAYYMKAREYSLAIDGGKLAIQPGSSDSPLLRLREGQGKPQMMITNSSDWTVIFTVKQTDYEYKSYIAKAGEWGDPLDVPLSFVKLSADRKKIQFEGPAFQIVFFQPISQ